MSAFGAATGRSPVSLQLIATFHRQEMMEYLRCDGVQTRIFWFHPIGMEGCGVGKYKSRWSNTSAEGPSSVLDCCSADGSTVFSCGTDKAVRMWQLGGAPPPNGLAQQIGAHDAPVKAVCFLPRTNLLVSGGWDRKLKFWDCRSSNPVGVLDLPERVYAMDAREDLLVVATANRHILAYDVSGQPREHSRKESPLKYQSRCVTAFPDRAGFAVGSIEGRVAIHYLQKVPGKDSFAFKCHRQDANVYAVNGIWQSVRHICNPWFRRRCQFWDKDNKQRLKDFHPIGQFRAPVSMRTEIYSRTHQAMIE
ncbi:hypothetical protein MHU86_25396 [Fragilaria crotonensis]|nr:hypothetical protein MHU86_25396 [Fragilaria crotonensis]